MAPLTSPAPPRLSTLLLGAIIAIGPVSVDMYLPAFPQIAAHFGPQTPQYSLAAYFAGFAAGQLIHGVLSDRFGRRTPLIAGLALYVAASLGCAAATNSDMFCLCRALAAFGAAAAIVVPRAAVRDVATGAAASGMMANVLMVMSAAPVLAPLAGSAVIAVTSWRAIFLAAALYGFAGIALTARFLPETHLPSQRHPLSLPALLARYRHILSDRIFVSYALLGSFGMAMLFAYLAGAPTVFEAVHGWSAARFGALLAVNGLVSIACFRINALAQAHWQALLTLGTWLCAAAAAAFLLLAPTASGLADAAVLLFLLAGYSFLPGNAQAGALTRHGAHAATAIALMSALQYSAGAAAGALIGRFADGSARPMAMVILLSALGALAAGTVRPRI